MIILILAASIALFVVARRSQIAAGLLFTLVAVILAGIAAGSMVSPLFFVTTAAVVALLIHASMQRPKPRDASADVVLRLPPAVGATVTQALGEIGPGEARDLLFQLVAQAAEMYAVPSVRFDEREERSTQAHVEELIEACCASAVELDRLDRVVASSPARRERAPGVSPTPSGEVNERLTSARAMLVQRLSDANTALRALYAADVAQGTEASDRVATLAAEIKSDARARGRAAEEMRNLLS